MADTRGEAVHRRRFGESETEKRQKKQQAAAEQDFRENTKAGRLMSKAEREQVIARSVTVGPGDPDLPAGPADSALAFFRTLAELKTQRRIRRSAGRHRGFLSLERNQPTGKATTG